MKRVMFIGYGAMAQKVHAMLPENIVLSIIIASPRSADRIRAVVGDSVQVITAVSELVETPDLAVEMAGQQGLKEHAIHIVNKGIPLGIISVGAFTDERFATLLEDTAIINGVKIHILAGAIAGIDAIHAASLAGLDEVTYQGRKNPASWQGSHADTLIDYDSLEQAHTFFTGSAREAAALFSANANVAATIALAGIGLDNTNVALIVDPTLEHNVHHITAKGVFGELEISMTGLPLAENPKTSSLAAFSALRLCCQLDEALQL